MAPSSRTWLERHRIQHRIRRHALRLVARSLVFGDSVIRVIRVQSENPLPEGATARRPTGLYAVIPHWYVPDRQQYLARCIESLLGIEAPRVEVAVITNEPAELQRSLQERLGGVRCTVVGSDCAVDANSASRGVEVVPWSRKGHPYYLTWEHKDLLRAATQRAEFSHFAYLEDDIRFPREAFEYWIEFRRLLGPYGLIPAFVRCEVRGSEILITDQGRRHRLADLPHVAVQRAGASLPLYFVNLVSPYQGIYLMDRVLAERHFVRSPARSPLRSRVMRIGGDWKVRERAAIGPIFDDVPSGFLCRAAAPVIEQVDGSFRIDRRCLVEHMPANYADDPTTPFGSMKLDDLFTE